jgi:hypothetical protein
MSDFRSDFAGDYLAAAETFHPSSPLRAPSGGVLRWLRTLAISPRTGTVVTTVVVRLDHS